MQEPRFTIRGANLCESLLRHTPEQIRTFLDRMAKWKMNTLIVHVAYGYRTYQHLLEPLCQERGIEIVYYLQTSLLFLQGADPTLFAKDYQGKSRTPKLENETRICVSSPIARDVFRLGARRYFEQSNIRTSAKILCIDADGYSFCQCPNCEPLGPAEQWAMLYEIILEEAEKSGKDLGFWYLSYVWRYSTPRDMRIFKKIETVLFDTHQRCRWATIGEEHALSVFNEMEGKADPRAREIPLNRYLQERLEEWRSKYSGNLVVFENLMLQGSISCPQPYTPQLVQDLDYYDGLGVDGVILEAFEPGLTSFEEQIHALSERMISHNLPPRKTTALEATCHRVLRGKTPESFNYKNQFNVLSYLTENRFDGLALLKDHQQDPVLQKYAGLLRAFLLTKTREACSEVLRYTLNHKARFDWIMIGFNLLRAIEPSIQGSTEAQTSFLKADKLWDWMETRSQPLTEAESVIHSLINQET